LLRVDRSGKEIALSVSKGGYWSPLVSPDGRKLAIKKQSETSREGDIWVLNLVTGNRTRLTSHGQNTFPLWSPEGRRLLFAGSPEATQILSIAADGSGAAETVLTSKRGMNPSSWSADGKPAYIECSGGKWQIWSRPISGNGGPELFSDSRFDFQDAQFSPDGRWMAYVSNETGSNEVWVRAFPGPGEKYRISNGGGVEPVWARDQRELFYRVYKPSVSPVA
jgi:Tol biopolymer transport system component